MLVTPNTNACVHAMKKMNKFPERDNRQRVEDVIVDYCRRTNIPIDAGHFIVADILQLILDDIRGYKFLVRMQCPPHLTWQDTNGLSKWINGDSGDRLYNGVINKITAERLMEEYKNQLEDE